jgi:uncharacterized protein (DUF952 family)
VTKLEKKVLLHVLTESEWQAARNEKAYSSLSFIENVFIHLCEEHQLSGVLERYFIGKPTLMVLVLDPAKLAAPVIFESTVEGSSEEFPHLYGSLNLDAIVEIREVLSSKGI